MTARRPGLSTRHFSSGCELLPELDGAKSRSGEMAEKLSRGSVRNWPRRWTVVSFCNRLGALGHHIDGFGVGGRGSEATIRALQPPRCPRQPARIPNV